jgi:hypothetical protein
VNHLSGTNKKLEAIVVEHPELTERKIQEGDAHISFKSETLLMFVVSELGSIIDN